MMESASDITLCKRLLEEIESLEQVDDTRKLTELEYVFEHLPSQAAPRLQKDLDHCVTRSDQVLGSLIERIDTSDKRQLNSALRLLMAYGNLRLALINYHIETARDEMEPDIRYTPILVKTKWYDLTPLLPDVENVTWKSILTHGLAKDPGNTKVRATCMSLLQQKVQFYASIQYLDRFRKQTEMIQNNAHRVAEKLSEIIFNTANDSQDVVMLNTFTCNLLMPFISVEQKTALLEAIIMSRFKTDLPIDLEELQDCSNKRLEQIVDKCIMNNASLQEIFLTKMVEQLRVNVIRRKRRHSMDNEVQDVIPLEDILTDVVNGLNTKETFLKLSSVEVTSKTLQRLYLRNWVDFVEVIITKKSLTPKSSTILLNSCSTILITCSKIIDDDTNEALCLLLARIVDSTGQRKLDKLFQTYNPHVLVEMTKLFAQSTELLDKFDTPLMRFYKSFLGRHMRLFTLRHFQKDVEKFSHFIEFICDRTVGKSKSTVLSYIYLCELSDFLEGIKSKSKIVDLYIGYGRSIAMKLYSYIKRRPFSKQTDVDEAMDTSCTNGCDESHSMQEQISDEVQTIVIDALVCVLKIAVDCREQPMLDTYGELMLKLFNHMVDRIKELIDETRAGSLCHSKPIDSNLHRLVSLYASHRSTIEPYLCYDLNKSICEKLLVGGDLSLESNVVDVAHGKRKLTYANIKSKLGIIQEKEELTYQTIINRQYSSVVDQNLGQAGNLSENESCAKHYMDQMMIITDVIAIASSHCDFETYDAVLSNVVKQFELADALDHPRILNLLHVLTALVPKHNEKDTSKADLFKGTFPTIGCSLIRIAKSVELGPSVLSFSNPGTHKSSGGIQCCTYSNCIRVYTMIFNRFPPTFTNPLITDAMQICVNSNLIRYAKYSTRLHKLFIQLASSITDLLKAVCMGKRNIVEQAMPVFLAVFSLLVRCIILASDREKLEDLPEKRLNGHGVGEKLEKLKTNGKGKIEQEQLSYEFHLECLARDVGRLLNNLCFLETKLVDYAPHLISAYLKDTQRASCPDVVKKHLDEGVFRVFNLVDSYQKDRLEQITDAGIQRKTIASRAGGSMFDMIHARLDQASREIFKDMHENYNKFHRYLGKC